LSGQIKDLSDLLSVTYAAADKAMARIRKAPPIATLWSRSNGGAGSHGLQAACVLGRPIEAVAQPIDIPHRRSGEDVSIEIVKKLNLDGVDRPSEVRKFAAARRPDPALSAEMKPNRRSRSAGRRPLIRTLHVLAGDKTIGVRRRDDQPGARFPATRAIALDGSMLEIQVGFEANGAAMTASGISIQAHFSDLTVVETPDTFAAGRRIRRNF
jgi:hypothetical protein